jgi:cytochrome c-type biogenesis protein CcmH
MVDSLAARLEQSPKDLEGWLRLARSYRELGEFDKAVAAARRAVALKPREVEPKLALAEAQLAATKDDRLSTDFIATMKEVLAIEPANAEAMYYVGAAEAQAGHTDSARKLWSRLLETLPTDSPNRPELVKQIGALPKK